MLLVAWAWNKYQNNGKCNVLMYNEAFGTCLNKGMQSHVFSSLPELLSSFLPFQLVYLSSSSK